MTERGTTDIDKHVLVTELMIGSRGILMSEVLLVEYCKTRRNCNNSCSILGMEVILVFHT